MTVEINPGQEYVVALAGGGFYWEPTTRTTYTGPDRRCQTAVAAKKFRTPSGAERVARTIPGARVRPYDREHPWNT